MARYTGPTSRINRRFGQAIFQSKKAEERKAYLPGIHGPRLRRKASEYAMGLNEKQKLRYMYGLTEKQFRLTFERAKKQRGVTGEIFMQLLDCRLDNVIYLLGFARTRKAARQMVTHGHVLVNGIKTDIPSYTCKPGCVVEVSEKSNSRQLAQRGLDDSVLRPVPAWLEKAEGTFKGTISRLPIRDEMDKTINEQLIVEFYSR
ncbi:MAG: 30S ribosomal protein S4 [Opitutales bacterium]